MPTERKFPDGTRFFLATGSVPVYVEIEVARVYDDGVTRDDIYYVMKLVDRESCTNLQIRTFTYHENVSQNDLEHRQNRYHRKLETLIRLRKRTVKRDLCDNQAARDRLVAQSKALKVLEESS